jgi:hypothetical protein
MHYDSIYATMGGGGIKLIAEIDPAVVLVTSSRRKIVKANGKVRLHKVKKTSATSYHIGRTWHLDEIKSIENVDVRRRMEPQPLDHVFPKPSVDIEWYLICHCLNALFRQDDGPL